MTMRIVVSYGEPTDPAQFDEYYARVHVPLAQQVPGLQKLTWGKVHSLDGSPAPQYGIASLYFADRAAVDVALASPEMKAAGKDLRNFATGGVTMYLHEEEVVS